MKSIFIPVFILFYSCNNHQPGNQNTAKASVKEIQADTIAHQKQKSLPADSALNEEGGYLSYIADAKNIKMYWKQNGKIIQTFQELKRIEPGLKFAMNGGMYTQDYAPVGLFIENGKQLKPVKRYNNPKVNFGLQPQGIFQIRNRKAEVIPVEHYKTEGIQYATQSAPMLVLNSRINPKLPHSDSRNIRNGVGILPNGKVLLVLSRNAVTFQEFAQYFVSKGCTSALYLDGGISEAYTPQYESYGFFGVLIGVVNK